MDPRIFSRTSFMGAGLSENAQVLAFFKDFFPHFLLKQKTKRFLKTSFATNSFATFFVCEKLICGTEFENCRK